MRWMRCGMACSLVSSPASQARICFSKGANGPPRPVSASLISGTSRRWVSRNSIGAHIRVSSRENRPTVKAISGWPLGMPLASFSHMWARISAARRSSGGRSSMPHMDMVSIQLRMRVTPKKIAACCTDFSCRGSAK